MTCVVGLIDSGKVWLGADRAGTIEEHFRILSLCKVFRIGCFIAGGRGSARALQLIQYKLKLRQSKTPLEVNTKYMATKFIGAINSCLKKEDGSMAGEGVENAWLVGYNRGNNPLLYHIQGDFSVFPISDFAAIGTGDKIALGVLYATQGKPPEERITLALEAAEYYIGTVRKPFDILCL